MFTLEISPINLKNIAKRNCLVGRAAYYVGNNTGVAN